MGNGQVCSDEDTVRSMTSTLITSSSARINGTVSHFSGNVTGLQLRYVRSGQTDTATASGSYTSALRNITGLQASTVYIYYYKTICGSGTARNSIGPFTFTTTSNTVVYADERPTRFNYIKVDSGLRIPSVDTSLYRASAGASIVYKTSDDTYYAYYVDCSCWRSLATDSAGVIAALDLKVDSVTISGDSLFWWNDHGVSHGYILPVINNMWKTTGNSGTTPGTNFIGTTDAQSLVIKTNAIERMRFNTSGAIAVGSGTDYGTAGYVLSTNGSAAAPTWVAPSALGITWQQTLTASPNLTQNNGSTISPGKYFAMQTYNAGHKYGYFYIKDSTINLELRSSGGSTISGISLSANSGNAGTNISALDLSTGHSSNINLYADSVVVKPPLGQFVIDTLTNAVGTKAIRYNPTTGLITYADTTTSNPGTVTSVATNTGTGITGGDISTTGTLALDTAYVVLTKYKAGQTYLPLAGAAYTTTTGDGLALTTSTLTTGNLMKLTNTSTVNNGAGLLSIVSSGANSTASKTTYGQQISVTNTGTTSTNVGLSVTASGATNNYAIIATGLVALGGTSTSYAAITQSPFNSNRAAIRVADNSAYAQLDAAGFEAFNGTNRMINVASNVGGGVAGWAQGSDIQMGWTSVAGSGGDGGNWANADVKISRARANVLAIGIGSSTIGDSTGSLTLDKLYAKTNVGIGTASPTFKLDVTGTGRFTDSVQLKHLKGNSLTPSITSGIGAGTAPTVSITGTDLAGEITVTTDTDPATSEDFCGVTFTTAYSTAPYVVIYPSNDEAILDLTKNASGVYVVTSSGGFRLRTNSNAPPSASTTLKFMYHVIQ